MNSWINVKDELPDKEGHYLLSCNQALPFVGFFKIYKKIRIFMLGQNQAKIYNVTHWMTLPEPPK